MNSVKNNLPYLRTPATMLPPAAVHKLQQAAMTDPDVPVGMSYRRQVALDETIKSLHLQHPEKFNLEN